MFRGISLQLPSSHHVDTQHTLGFVSCSLTFLLQELSTIRHHRRERHANRSHIVHHTSSTGERGEKGSEQAKIAKGRETPTHQHARRTADGHKIRDCNGREPVQSFRGARSHTLLFLPLSLFEISESQVTVTRTAFEGTNSSPSVATCAREHTHRVSSTFRGSVRARRAEGRE